MNGRDRVRMAMNLQEPDRVPIMCQLSVGHMLLNLDVSPVEFWCDPAVFSRGLLKLREMYDFDGILVSLHGHDPHWRSAVRSQVESTEGILVEWMTGDRTLFPHDELPRHEPRVPVSPRSLEDLSPSDPPSELTYIPVSQGLHFRIDPDHPFDIFRELHSALNGAYSLHGEVTSPFDYYLDFVGLENGLMGLIEFPGKAHMVLERFTALVASLAGALALTGVDAIKISSPYAGSGFISKQVYADFVVPWERRVAAAVRSAGVHVYTHTCGAIGDRLELMFDAGVSGIECLDPPPLGNVELAEAKRRTQGRGFIKGNVDSVTGLLNGDRESILEDARERIRIGSEGGGFIFSTACSVAPRVPRQHVLLLREAVERWG